MATKISGFSEPDIDFHPMRLAASITIRANANPGDVPCAILIGESKVFTDSEVRAKDEDLRWAMTWMRNEAGYLRERGTPQPALELAIEVVLERHGIVLDPA